MDRISIPRPNWAAVPVLYIALFATAATHGESFPYEARIVVPGAPIRSGPGDAFYITDTLAEGQTVEVYRHRHNGWCAIRPPEQSFSWIFSSHLRLTGDSLGEIDKNDVASRIGSRLSQQRNAVQVRLNKGEVVQILGETNEGGQKWYKVAPPAGEFRWIHSTCLRHTDGSPISTVATNELAGHTSAPATGPTAPLTLTKKGDRLFAASPIVTTSATNEESVASAIADAAASGPETPTADWRAAPVAPPLAPITPLAPPSSPVRAETAIPRESSASPSSSPAIVPEPAETIASQRGTSKTLATPESGDADRQLAEIELRLSRMIAEPPTTWQVDPLQRETEELLSRAPTVNERDAVKFTLEKVERFAAIQRRYQHGGAVSQPNAAHAAVVSNSAVTPLPGAASGTTADETGRFDAVGVLRPVVSKRPGAPQFALVDPRGQVVSFVSPTPDMNLQPYVGRRVGVIGNRGFIPEFHRAHVTAGRIQPLEERLVR